MPRTDEEFKNRVYDVVGSIPKGRVMSYGQVAAHAGAPWAAWEVGQIAHLGPSHLPWQRVVNKNGGLARGYPGGMEGHKKALEAENIGVDDEYRVKINEHIWHPVNKNQNSLL